MSKLFTLKKWLTIKEAAKYLSKIFEEKVSSSDICQLAIDGHLVLSTHFINPCHAKLCDIVNFENIQTTLSLKGDYEICLSTPLDDDLNFKDRRYLNTNEKLTYIDGVWDLYLEAGAGALYLKHARQWWRRGPSITSVSMDGIYVTNTNGDFALLHDVDDDMEYPTGFLPGDAELVVRVSHIQDLIRSAEEKITPPSSSITDTTQRNYELAIGLLTKALADKAGANCGTKENPNISGLSELLQIYLPADRVGSLSNKALSISTSRKKLKAGYDSLEKI